jgi:hypothetical protein
MRPIITVLVIYGLVLPAVTQQKPLLHFPADPAPRVAAFGAYPDDGEDDTEALQNALDHDRPDCGADFGGYMKTLYLPAGTYLVSSPISFCGWKVVLQGQGPGHTIIKLQDNTPLYATPDTSIPVIMTGAGNRQHGNLIRDMTISVGSGNPSAVALDFIASNYGGLDNLHIVSEDGQGVAGIDFRRYGPGPLLVSDVEIDGFDYGILVANAEYAPTFERIVLRNQHKAGIHNTWNILSCHDITTYNCAPAIYNRYGQITAIDCRFNGGASDTAALVNTRGQLYARHIRCRGFRAAVTSNGTDVGTDTLEEYVSSAVCTLFASPKRSLHLPVRTAPRFHEQDTTQWAQMVSPGWYGDNRSWDDSIRSGKSTVWWRAGVFFAANKRYHVPETVRKFCGFGSHINAPHGSRALTLIVDSGDARTPALIIDNMHRGIWVEHACKRPVVLRHGKYNYTAFDGAGDLYLEDAIPGQCEFIEGQRVWARQYNIEHSDWNIRNYGADLWILGLKTERRGLVIETKHCGNTELLGGLLYTNTGTPPEQPPGFLCIESNMSLIYGTSVYGGNIHYETQIRHRMNARTYELPHTALQGRYMPLYAGFDEEKCTGAIDRSPRPGAYPRPVLDCRFSQNTLIVTTSRSALTRLRIHSPSGRRVALSSTGSTTARIDFSPFPQGVYLISLPGIAARKVVYRR